MKKILVLFLFTLIYQTSFSQSRTNKVIPKFEESSPEIKKAVGWALNNTTGKWIENANLGKTANFGNARFQRSKTSYSIGKD